MNKIAKIRHRLFALLLAFLPALSFAQTEIRVETHKVVAQDEQFNVTFIIEGEHKATDFNWEESNDFQLLWGPQQGTSTSVSIINGKTTRSVQTTFTYVLKPIRQGTFTLAPATAKVKGNTIRSAAVSVEVVSGGASQSSGQSSGSQTQSGRASSRQEDSGNDQDIFLRLEVNRSNVVVGEPIIATVKLYQRANITGFESANFPTFNGFWSQELEAPTNIEFSRETLDGRIYNSALLRKYVLIPQQKGTITIGPADLTCLVNVRVSSGGASIFDGFFDDYRTVRRKVSTKPVDIHVSALPAGAPASFAGGVGSFKISAKLSKDSLKTHEAASVLVTISGKGNVSLLGEPKISFPPDMETYDTKVSEKVEKGGLAGSKYFEYPFIPRSHGDFVLEPIQYTYYDINSGKYVTLQTQPLPVHVEKSDDADNSSVSVPGVVRKDVKTLGSDIRYIDTKNAGFGKKDSFVITRPVFYVSIALVILLALLSWAAFRKLAQRRLDVVGARNRKATKMAMRRLRQAESFLKQDLYTAFYEELHKALLGFISDKLNIPVAELSKDNIAEALTAGGVPSEHTDAFLSVLDACEFARYSPSGGHQEMDNHYRAALEVISSIDSSMKSKKHSNATGGTLILVALLSLAPLSGKAADNASLADSLWTEGNRAYAEGRWEDASANYEAIRDLSLESASLYCNLGNAYFKQQNIAEAIVNYERALKLSPSYSDAKYNLAIANEMIQDKIDPVPEFILKVWARNIANLMDSNAWAWLFVFFLAATLALGLLFILGSTASSRRAGFFTALVTLLLGVFSLTFSIWLRNENLREDYAVITRPVISVKSSPSEGSAKDLFILHEGTKVTVIDQVGNWSNIELSDGRQGWMLSEDYQII